MIRPRKTDRHLPPCVYEKHGAFWYVKAGKWTRLGATLADALVAYAGLVEAPKGGMAKLVDDVLAHHSKKVADSTRAQYAHAAKILKRKLEEFSPEQVKSKHVAALKLSMADTPNMANRALSFLRTVFTYAVEWGVVDSNPCVGVRRHVEPKRTRLLSDDEWNAIHDRADPRLRVIMELQYLTGQRISDVLAIRRSQLTDEGIEFEQQKTGTKLVVRWSQALRGTVGTALALSAGTPTLTLLRGRYGGAPDYRSVVAQWNNACAAAEVEDARLNDGRARSATDASRQGQDAQRLLGHASAAMTQRYIRGRETPAVTGPEPDANVRSIRQSNRRRR